MEFGPILNVRELPSLTDAPARYPDARLPAARTAFTLVGAEWRELRGPLDVAALDAWLADRGGGFADRVALLAVGSNAYPRQLFDKFAGLPCAEHGIVTAPAVAADLGVAFCPIRSRKGYVPVTAARRDGHAERTWLQWLTEAQLARVRETEGPRYALVGGAPLAAAVAPADGLPRPPTVYAWWFDSVLLSSQSESSGATLGTAWFDARDADAEARAIARLSALSEAELEAVAAPNPVPTGWDRLS